MTDAERQAAKVACERATAGPWEAHQPADDDGWWWVWKSSALPNYGAICECLISDGADLSREKSDAEFIALARTALPAALAELDAKDVEIARLREALRQIACAANGSVPMMDFEDDGDTGCDQCENMQGLARAALAPAPEEP